MDPHLDHPFDVAFTAPAFEEADHPASQSDLIEAALRTAAYNQRSTDLNFYAQPCSSRSLDYLQSIYEKQDHRAAVQMLARRNEIDWRTSKYHVSNQDPRLTWQLDRHYIDMLVCVSGNIGVSILLPSERDHTFSFQFDFGEPYRRFSAKFAKLGFDAKGSFLWVGMCRGCEDVFIAWAPVDSLRADHDADKFEVGLETGKTNLTQEHYRLTVSFFAHVIAMLGVRGIWVSQQYPDLKNKEEWAASTNILEQRVPLTSLELESLDRHIRDSYDDWIHTAPDSYKEDGFVLDRRPIIVTSRYGQNQEMIEGPQDARSWKRVRNFQHIHYMSFAIATHFRARLATEGWENRDLHAIRNQHPDGVFLNPDHTDNRREHIPWTDLETLYVEDQMPTLYSYDGFLIQQRLGLFSPQSPPLGVLLNIATISDLFKTNHRDNTVYTHGLPGPKKSPKVTLYPQAGLRSAGHFQSSGLMTAFYPLVEALNNNLRDPLGEGGHFPVLGIACQGYNSVMHAIRGFGAQHHEAQQGLITAVLGGQFACDDTSRDKAAKFERRCNHHLPHENFARKISNKAITRDLRLENVYVIDMTALRQEDRSGDIVFTEILCPLARLWGHSSLLDPVIEHTVLFDAKAYPSIYNWATYPLTALIEINWEAYHDIIMERVKDNVEKLAMQVGVTEVIACTERAFNFMHTGNPAVIKTTVMNPLWIGRSIIEDGLPCFNPTLVKISDHQPAKLTFGQWPYEDLRKLPKSAAESALKYRYNDLAVAQGPRQQRAASCIYTSLVALVSDSQRLVSHAVTTECNKALLNPDQEIQDSARQRLKHLATWLNCKYPFAWQEPGDKSTTTYALLVKVLCKPDSEMTALVKSDKSFLYSQLAEILLNWGLQSTDENPAVIAPLVKGGICPMTLGITAQMTLGMMSSNKSATLKLWEMGLQALRIDFLPWHSNRARARTSTHDCWMFIQGGSSQIPDIPVELQNHEGVVAQAIATTAANQDPSGSWTVPTALSELRNFFHKTVLPSEWNVVHASLPSGPDAEYVRQTYIWLKDNFNAQKLEHRLGLVIGIMFSRLLPQICTPPLAELKEKVHKGLSSQDLTRIVRELNWVRPPEDKKGMRDVEPYITMMSTSIIALLDSESPLRRYLNGHSNNFGNVWTKKHSAKYLYAMNFVRCGIAKGIKHSMIERPRFQANWTIETPAVLETLWNDLKNCLEIEQFGVFMAFRRVFGEEAARRAGEQGHFALPPSGLV